VLCCVIERCPAGAAAHCCAVVAASVEGSGQAGSAKLTSEHNTMPRVSWVSGACYFCSILLVLLLVICKEVGFPCQFGTCSGVRILSHAVMDVQCQEMAVSYLRRIDMPPGRPYSCSMEPGTLAMESMCVDCCRGRLLLELLDVSYLSHHPLSTMPVLRTLLGSILYSYDMQRAFRIVDAVLIPLLVGETVQRHVVTPARLRLCEY
jgi:hypothetical protein